MYTWIRYIGSQTRYDLGSTSWSAVPEVAVCAGRTRTACSTILLGLSHLRFASMSQGDSYHMSVPEVIKVQKVIVEGQRRKEQCHRSMSVSDKRAPSTIIARVSGLRRHGCFMCVGDFHGPWPFTCIRYNGSQTREHLGSTSWSAMPAVAVCFRRKSTAYSTTTAGHCWG